MRIKEIAVFNQRLNVKLPNGLTLNDTPSCELTAELAEGDDVEACTRELRETVEAELAKHEQLIVDVYLVNQKMAEDQAAKTKVDDQEALRERRRQFLRNAQTAAGPVKPAQIIVDELEAAGVVEKDTLIRMREWLQDARVWVDKK